MGGTPFADLAAVEGREKSEANRAKDDPNHDRYGQDWGCCHWDC